MQILTSGDSAILLCSVTLLAALMFLPQLSGKQMPNFRPLDTQVRKAEFFAFLDPIVADVSANVSAERSFILDAVDRLETKKGLSWLRRRKLNRIAQYYEVETEDADLATPIPRHPDVFYPRKPGPGCPRPVRP